MDLAIIIQARMSSNRLPGKVLKKVLDRPLLDYQIGRLRCCKEADSVIVATSNDPSDDPIATYCDQNDVPYCRGPLEDVLSRFIQAASTFSVNTIVRSTADCPLIDPQLVDQAILEYRREFPKVDYLSNGLESTFPRGFDIEVFSYKTLCMVDKEASLPHHREHVTPFIYEHPERFSLKNIRSQKDLSGYRFTVDTPQDFELISRILGHFYSSPALHSRLLDSSFGLADCIELLEQHPHWKAINSNVRQKPIRGNL